MDEETEKTKRTDIVLGIVGASAIGFILSLFADVYYRMFLVGDLKWENVNHIQVYSLLLLLLALIGFLQFFIDDYKNNVEINRSLLKRYFIYFFYQFTPGKIIRFIVGIYTLTILAIFLGFIYYIFAQSVGYLLATALFLLSALSAYLRERKK